jgi:hypothetical protein
MERIRTLNTRPLAADGIGGHGVLEHAMTADAVIIHLIGNM